MGGNGASAAVMFCVFSLHKHAFVCVFKDNYTEWIEIHPDSSFLQKSLPAVHVSTPETYTGFGTNSVWHQNKKLALKKVSLKNNKYTRWSNRELQTFNAEPKDKKRLWDETCKFENCSWNHSCSSSSQVNWFQQESSVSTAVLLRSAERISWGNPLLCFYVNEVSYSF